MPTPTYIRKYPNRRLYSVSAKGYVTQEDVIQMIRSGEHVVIRVRSQNEQGKNEDREDVTDEVLLGAIKDSPPLLAALVKRVNLRTVIREAP